MFQKFRLGIALAATVFILAACGEVEDTRPGQPVKHRQEAFKSILRAFEPLGVMLREEKYKADRANHLAEELVARRDGPWSYFGPDTDYPPSKATAEVWKQPEAFLKEKEAFFAATDKLLATVKTGDKAAVGKAYDAVHDRCKSCHRTFKTR